MSSQLEHDYIGLSESPSMEKKTPFLSSSSSSSSSSSYDDDEKVHVLNFKETELRLGLPGSDSPERKAGVELRLDSLSPLKNFASGAKRGFSDAINGSQKWGFSVNGGSGLGLDGKISPVSSKTQQSCLPETMKEVVPPSPKPVQEKNTQISSANQLGTAPASKAQVVGWPPIRSFRKNNMATNSGKDDKDDKSGSGSLYVKVSMDGAPYLRKVDLNIYSNYMQLSSALKKMFSCFTIGQCSSEGLKGRDGLSESHLKDLLHGSEYVLTYEDKDGDWMLVGDVPWEMFIDLCKKVRIMKGSEAIGLAPRTSEKWKLS